MRLKVLLPKLRLRQNITSSRLIGFCAGKLSRGDTKLFLKALIEIRKATKSNTVSDLRNVVTVFRQQVSCSF
jgi:hypothetical protein